MPTVHIDGQSYEFEKGEKLLQFCLDHGIEIPHFCYHPALSVPANCRQCLVKAGTPGRDRATGEVEKDDKGEPIIRYFPKLMPSCALDLADDMVVHTQLSEAEVAYTEKAGVQVQEIADAQKGNLELLLINHPLDCPICDQAGHCPLQIQAYKYGPEGSRFEHEKNHKPKRVELGPNVILDAERCINCTRCTRFTSEISESHQLSIVNRGDKNYPLPAPGQPFDDPYSMNVCDICPVGALTEKYFRFKARIWEMAGTPSVSAFGGKGINVTYWTKDNQILRITPRTNDDVNEFWMPDAARLIFDTYNTNRPEAPTVQFHDGGRGPVEWAQAFDGAAKLLKDADPAKTLFLGSPFATVEDNYLLARLAKGLGAAAPQYARHVEAGAGDGKLITDDQAPNTQGVERLGFEAVDADLLRTRLRSGEIELLYVLDDDPVGHGLFSKEDLGGVTVIAHHYHQTSQTAQLAKVAFPAAMTVETVGTYVNLDGRAQRVVPAKAIAGVNRTLSMEMSKSRLDHHGTPFDRWHSEANRVNCQPGWAVLPEVAKRLDLDLEYKGPRQIMAEIAEHNPGFAGATYEAMGGLGVQLEEVGAAAV